MTDQPNPSTPLTSPNHAKRERWGRTPVLAAIVVAFALGAGGTALFHKSHTVTYVAVAPAPISAMTAGAPVAIQGTVAEIFGNKFIVQDPTGRALVETGRRGEGGNIVAKAEPVTVQGRFELGFVHAVAIRHADGRTDTLDMPPPRPDGPRPHEALVLR